MNDDPATLAPAVKELHARFADAGRRTPEIAAGGTLRHRSAAEDMDRLYGLAAQDVTDYIHGAHYDDLDGVLRSFDPLMERIESYRTR